MDNCILVGCDLHDKSMLLKYAVGTGKSSKRSFPNRLAGHVALVEWLRELSGKAGGAAVYFGYEASGQGFVLHDRLTAAGFSCFVLAPSKMERSPKSRTTKCDERDAERVLCLVRRHVLTSEELPSVWVPDRATRDERELTRGRQAVAEELAKAKTEVRMLLRLLIRNPKKRKKIAIVAMMRRLAIRLWHLAKGEAPPEPRAAQTRTSAISQEP